MKFSRIILFIMVALLTACNSPTSSHPSVKTIEWENSGEGYRHFYTNDTQWYNYGMFRTAFGPDLTFTSGSATIRKVSGGPRMGYGVLFCYVDNATYYRVLIVDAKKFNAWKVSAGEWTQLIDWTDSAAIKTNGQDNTIAVSRDVNGNFTITINGEMAGSFNDTELTSDTYGIIAIVGDASGGENFPDVPEEFRANILTPTALPASSSVQSSTWAFPAFGSSR